jgi:anti-sigma B factor antagonist
VNLTIDQDAQENLAIVTVTGEIDVFSSPRLREELLALIQDGRVQLIVDVSGVEFLDSTGLGVLVGIYHRLRTWQGSLAFVGANERVRRVFHITQLDRIFVIHESVEAARKSLSSE